MFFEINTNTQPTMIRNTYSSPPLIVYIDSSTESKSPSPIIPFIPDDASSPESDLSFVPDDDANSSPESDFSPIITFATNEDTDSNPRSDSLPVADFIPEENAGSGPNLDSSGFWWWPENQLGLPKGNLDNEGEIRHHEKIVKY